MNTAIKKNPEWTVPLMVVLVLTPFFSYLDLSITRFFYSIGNDPVEHFVSHPILDFLYSYGPIPAQITVGVASFILVFSYLRTSLAKWRNPALTLILTLSMGAGLMTHLVLKDHWGRPRPKQVKEFGGSQDFRPFYKPNFFKQPMPSRSFPCGHCTTGFFFFVLALLGKRYKSNPIKWLGFILAWSLGIALSIMRIAHGGHFFSDTVFSALIMWYTSLTIDWLVYSNENAYTIAKASV
ncbi:MAG: phosphatase PAP2 family protein [Parachlamydiaceae bacterium]